MRMLLRVTLDVEAANHLIRENKIQDFMQARVQALKPEAAYFTADQGARTAYFFFDLKDTSQIPSIAEPFFQTLNANVEFLPVMNADDLRAGLEQLGRLQRTTV